jgi:hypothetical protein
MERVQALNIDVITGAVNPIPKIKDSGDDTLWVTFESASHFDDVATREQGRPVFEMRDYIKIIIPGDTSQVIHRPVRESDKERFPNQWLAYQTGATQDKGYPLSEWPLITRAQVDELVYFKINTVEQLAHVSDATAQKFMGLNDLRTKAKVYLEKMAGEQPELRLQAEVMKKDEEIAALKQQMDRMNEAILELQTKRGKRSSEAA